MTRAIGHTSVCPMALANGQRKEAQVPHDFVPCQDPPACPPRYQNLCHKPVFWGECHLPAGHAEHRATRTLTEVLDPVDPHGSYYDPDLLFQILASERDPTRGYGSAEEAVQLWLESLYAPTRVAEADHLQDCLVKVLLHLIPS